MHEMGHNLALKHGHVAQQGHGQTFPKLPRDHNSYEYDHNSYEYSVMTYAQFVGDNPRNGDDAPDHPTTYMQNDIAALQYLYGANYGHKSGNTHYAWSPKTGECFIDGTGQGRPIHNYILQTVWDGGGVDTYDFSKYSHGVHVDLSPGAWSRTTPGQLANLGSQGNGPDHFARGSIANALLHEGDTRALIENVIGSRGNDSITGNRADNVIGGGGGRDILEGLGGADAFVFTARPIATNVDRIADFRTIDTLRLDDHGFRALDLGRLATSAFETIGSGDARVDGSARILYDRGKGDLYYDPDGGGANGRVKFVQIDNHARLGADDVLVV